MVPWSPICPSILKFPCKFGTSISNPVSETYKSIIDSSYAPFLCINSKVSKPKFPASATMSLNQVITLSREPEQARKATTSTTPWAEHYGKISAIFWRISHHRGHYQWVESNDGKQADFYVAVPEWFAFTRACIKYFTEVKLFSKAARLVYYTWTS